MTVPDTFKLWAKAFAQLGGAIAVAVLPVLSTGASLKATEWVNVALLAVGAIAVWNTTNHPAWPYGKMITSGLIAGLTTLNSFIAGPITREEVIQIVLAIFTTFVVGVTPNAVPESDITDSLMNPEGP